MQVSEANFQQIIPGQKQYHVPKFQREYTWKLKQWDDLWNDIIDLHENNTNDDSKHFIGSIVTIPSPPSPNENIVKYLLIDGQQRLTTVFILLILLRDMALKEGNQNLAGVIETSYLINQFVADNLRIKIISTEINNDRGTLLNLVNRIESEESSLITKCYTSFRKKISVANYSIDEIYQIVITKLSLVSIVLGNDDNPYVVFESLNNRGAKLSEADLIRNYFFMQIDEQYHTQYWQPMQDALGEDLTDFMRHYLGSYGSIVKKNNVFLDLKNRINSNGALEEIKLVSKSACFYDKILHPEKEEHAKIKMKLFRFKRLDFTVLHPFLLACYKRYDENKDADEFFTVLDTLENFLIRRLACKIPTNGLNKIFPTLYKKASEHLSFCDGVKKCLSAERYPSDEQFQNGLETSVIYNNSDRTRAKIILETLESSFGHKESVLFENAEIEHIMPQTISQEWRRDLGDDWKQQHDLLLHTLGNLTLTGYNSELSNKPFEEKKNYYASSNFSLNQYFKEIPKWNANAIQERAKYLAEIALKEWSNFQTSQYTSTSNISDSEQSISHVTASSIEPTLLTILGDEYPVNSWLELYVAVIRWIVEYDPSSITQLASDYPNFIGRNANIFKESKVLDHLVNGHCYYFETILTDGQIYQFCNQAMLKIGLYLHDDWSVKIG